MPRGQGRHMEVVKEEGVFQAEPCDWRLLAQYSNAEALKESTQSLGRAGQMRLQGRSCKPRQGYCLIPRLSGNIKGSQAERRSSVSVFTFWKEDSG